MNIQDLSDVVVTYYSNSFEYFAIQDGGIILYSYGTNPYKYFIIKQGQSSSVIQVYLLTFHYNDNNKLDFYMDIICTIDSVYISYYNS